MSAGLTKRDKQQGRQQAWHLLTKIDPNLGIDGNYLTEWDIVQVPIELNFGGLTFPSGVTKAVTSTGWKMLVGSDDFLPIGKPFANSYTPVTNRQFLDMIKEAISGVKGAVVESVGSVCDRSKIFVSISIKGADKYTIGNRQFMDYLNFGTSHDQSTTVWANSSNICTVCFNTFMMNFEGNQAVKVKVRHSKDVIAKLENITEVIDA